MGGESPPRLGRRNTRSSSFVHVSSTSESTRETDFPAPSLSDLLFGKPISLDSFSSTFPARQPQIQELIRLVGPLNCPLLPIFVYGGASTGKTSIVIHLFRHLNRPLIYSSCITCYSPRILFESILDQVLLHRKNPDNGFTSAKRCDKPLEFINYLKEGLTNLVSGLEKLPKHGVKDLPDSGRMIYLIFDNVERVRDWDRTYSILPFLFKLHEFLEMPEVGIIFISSASMDTYHSPTGFAEPIFVHFPGYSEADLREIFMGKQSNPKLYGSFLDVALRPLCRITRRVDELENTLTTLFRKYCEPLDDMKGASSEETKRRLFVHIQPHIKESLDKVFSVLPWPLKHSRLSCVSKKKESMLDLDFHMSVSSKYLLMSAFLASRNPATLDASLFDSRGGHDNRKRRRKNSEKGSGRKDDPDVLALKGPGTFPLERLLAIFQCITSAGDDEGWEEESEDAENGLMSDVLLQLSGLCNANFMSRGGSSCSLLDGAIRFRCTASEDVALRVARSLKFPLSRYLSRG